MRTRRRFGPEKNAADDIAVTTGPGLVPIISPVMEACDLRDHQISDLSVLTVSHRTASSMRTLADLTLDRETRAEQLQDLRRSLGVDELVYLATCNRVAFVVLSRRPASELFARLGRWFGEQVLTGDRRVPPADEWLVLSGPDAVDHLVRVGSALDSMVLGERQILGQLKQAYQDAVAADLCTSRLGFVLEQIFAVAKRVFSETDLARGRLSMVALVADELARFRHGRPRLRAALVGAGEMTEKLARTLVKGGGVELLFVNRTVDKARTLASRHGGRALALKDFLAAPEPVDLLATSTAAPATLFDRDFLDRCRGEHGLLAVDLAVPADIDPAAGDLDGVRLLDLEALRRIAGANLQERQAAIGDAERIVTEGIGEIVDRWREREVGPYIGDLIQRTTEESLGALRELLSGDLAHLGEAEKRVLERWAARQAKQWAVLQASGIRHTSRNCCLKAVTSYLQGMESA